MTGDTSIWVPVVAAGVTGIAAWFTAQHAGKVAMQQALNTGFKDLLASVQADHKDCHERLTRLEERYNAARLRGEAERAQLRGEIINLTQVIISLENLLREQGIDIPERLRVPAVNSTLSGVADEGAVILFQETDDDDQGF